MDKRMKKHGGNVMAGLLADYGVTAVFGVPGGQTLPLYYGILDEGNRIRHILMKDEIDATFAADAYARISGGIGVCDATAGCGAIKFISGLAEAYNTSIPVIAIGSEMEGDWLAARYRGTGSQVVDSKEVLKPVTKWQACLPHVNKMPELVQTAAQMAVSGRPGPVLSSVHGGPSGRNIPGRTMRATENWPACPPTVLPRPATKSTRRSRY
ncbi:MAG: thiamine pyrophosphate-binding protein [Flavonifractor plautii]